MSLENKDLTERLLLALQEEDRIKMGAEAHTSFLKHLKEIRQQAEKEFGYKKHLFRDRGTRCYDQGKIYSFLSLNLL